APGMWPPLFHLALGLFMLPGWPPQAAALALLALLSVWAAWRLYHMVDIMATRVAALFVAGLFPFIPVLVEMTSAVMLDIVVAMLALEATYWLAVYFDTENWRHAALFGLFTACCCLTKGTG